MPGPVTLLPWAPDRTHGRGYLAALAAHYTSKSLNVQSPTPAFRRTASEVTNSRPDKLQALSFQPLRKIHQTMARHATRKPQIAARLMPTGTSAWP